MAVKLRRDAIRNAVMISFFFFSTDGHGPVMSFYPIGFCEG